MPKCECVDDRFSTGFGSTYEVVVNDFPKREEEVEITIFGDSDAVFADFFLLNHQKQWFVQ